MRFPNRWTTPGLANDSLGAPVPILILRYDPKDRPPPGAREMGVQNPWLMIARDYTAEICKHDIYIYI